MITDEQIGRQSSEERIAWLNSLNADEDAIAHTPVGHRYSLVLISETKRFLEHELSAAHRLKFLEFLDSCTDNFLKAEAIALVEPMCDEAYQMVKEARKLGAAKALDVFARWEIFNAFVALNPSLLTAIKMSSGSSYGFRRSAQNADHSARQ
jgi:hypothetical protein